MKRDQKLRDRYGYGEQVSEKGTISADLPRKILVESTEMCYDMSVGKIYMQIWFIGRTLASQAGKAGSIPVICCLIPCISRFLQIDNHEVIRILCFLILCGDFR